MHIDLTFTIIATLVYRMRCNEGVHHLFGVITRVTPARARTVLLWPPGHR